MNIFAIMLVKNEVDIVEYVLKEAEKWATKVFILDNGSTDGTWELVNSLKNDIITPWKQYFGDYTDGLRSLVFHEFKHMSKPGDWWCFKLDADEVYAEDPREFLKTIPKNCHMVAKQSLDYVITNEDLNEYNFTNDFSKDRMHLKYFKKLCWSEPRFFRFRKNLTWTNTPSSQWPDHIGVLAEKNILVRHYQFRNPEQMQRRLDSRNNSMVKKAGYVWHEITQTDWHELLVPRSEAVYDNDNLEEFRKLEINRGNFKQGKLKAFIKRVLIFFGLYN